MSRYVMFALVAIAAMASMATGAHAQEAQLEAIDEVTREACDPCVAHVVGESAIVVLPFGIVSSRCQDEFDVVVYHDGTGEVDWSGSPHGAPGCNVTNCTTMSSHWEFQAQEADAGIEHVIVEMCLRTAGGAELECAVEFGVSIEPTSDHAYRYQANQACGNTLWQFDAEHEDGNSPYELLHVS